MESIKITNDKKEMAAIGKGIVEDRSDIYSPLMLEKIIERVKQEFPNLNAEEQNEIMYSSIYDYWVYGNTIDEEFYLHLYEKNHEEKRSYMTNRIRSMYVDYLNCGDDRLNLDVIRRRAGLLEMKYELYKWLKPYYKRDVIEIITEDDFDTFKEFVSKHQEFVVKPSDFTFGIGVHKVSISDYKDVKDAFDNILDEGKAINKKHPSRQTSIVIEELIIQSKELAALHPSSINGIRATAIRDKNGMIQILHPWIKCGVGGQFVASAALDGFDAEIDAKTGVIISDGYSENGTVYKVHPDSGITIKGYQIPRWDELISFVDEIMSKLPDYRYIGWDLVLTDDGWVVMEGNYSGECTWQLIRNCGGRAEIEEIIGWKLDKEFWWQVRPFVITKKQDVDKYSEEVRANTNKMLNK